MCTPQGLIWGAPVVVIGAVVNAVVGLNGVGVGSNCLGPCLVEFGIPPRTECEPEFPGKNHNP